MQFRAHYRGFEGSQRATLGEKHARHFSRGAECQQHDDDCSALRLSRHGTREDQQNLVCGVYPEAARWQFSALFCGLSSSVSLRSNRQTIKCIRSKYGDGGNKKFFFPVGEREQKGVQLSPRAVLIFSRPRLSVVEHAATR